MDEFAGDRILASEVKILIRRQDLYDIYSQATRKDRATEDKPYLVTDLEIIAAKSKKLLDENDLRIVGPSGAEWSATDEQRRILDLISDTRRSEDRIRSVVASRELALDEAEADLHHTQNHRSLLERKLEQIQEEIHAQAKKRLADGVTEEPTAIDVEASLIQMEREGEVRRGMPSNEEVRAAAHLGVRGDE